VRKKFLLKYRYYINEKLNHKLGEKDAKMHIR
jgi:hypothetical protein